MLPSRLGSAIQACARVQQYAAGLPRQPHKSKSMKAKSASPFFKGFYNIAMRFYSNNRVQLHPSEQPQKIIPSYEVGQMDKYAVEASMVRRRIEHIRRKAPIMTVEDEGDVTLLSHTLKTNASLAAVQESQMVPENTWDSIVSQLPVMVDQHLSFTAAVMTANIKLEGATATANLILSDKLSLDQKEKLLQEMAQNPNWREDRFFDVLVHVLSNNGYLRFQPITVARIISQLPRVPISRKAPHYTISTSDFTTLLSNEQRDDLKTEWLPHELGRLIGNILKTEEELDYMINLIRYLGEVWAEQEGSRLELLLPGEELDDVPLRDRLVRAGVRWNDFLGYMGTIATDAAASNKHWVDEDWCWILNDLQHDLGDWAHQNLDAYGKLEHILYIADMVATLSIKLGDFHHDYRIIQIALNMICVPIWPEADHALLAEILTERMKNRTWAGRAALTASYLAGSTPSATDKTASQSALWEAPPYWLDALHGKAKWSVIGKLRHGISSPGDKAIVEASKESHASVLDGFELVKPNPDLISATERQRRSLLPKDDPEYLP